MATSSRRAIVLDALFLSSVGTRKRFDALLFTGPDLFAGQFQESMEAEAKCIKAADKINVKKLTAPKAKAKEQSSYTIPRRHPQQVARGGFRNWTETQPDPSIRLRFLCAKPPIPRGMAQVTLLPSGGLPPMNLWGAAFSIFWGPGFRLSPTGGSWRHSGAVTHSSSRGSQVHAQAHLVPCFRSQIPDERERSHLGQALHLRLLN